MPNDVKNQQTLEPVHVRVDNSSNPSASRSPEPAGTDPAMSGKPEQSPEPTAAPPVQQKPAPKVNSPKKSSSGVTAAIVATVVIVLGLAALAVFAYIKTKK